MGLFRGRALVACGVLSTIVIGVWACSQGDPSPPLIPDQPTKDSGAVVTTDGGTKTDASQTCFTDDGGCNTLQNCGARVFILNVAQAPPTAQGGTIPDGTYVLTDYRVFTGAGGQSGTTSAWFTETMTLATEASDGGTSDAGATQQMLWQDIAASSTNTTSVSWSGTAYFAGTNLEIDKTCSSASQFLGTYSVTGTQLVFLVDDGANGTGQLTYTKK